MDQGKKERRKEGGKEEGEGEKKRKRGVWGGSAAGSKVRENVVA
jgi:hypothetical protein